MTERISEKRARRPVAGNDPPPPMPTPRRGERPAAYADRVGEWYVAQKSVEHRKDHGLYLTPVRVADFMADRIRTNGTRLRMLDPAAGGGILSCAAMEVLVRRPDAPMHVELVAYEMDTELIPALRAVLGYLADWCRTGHNVVLDVRIEAADFILSCAEALRLRGGFFPHRSGERGFDVVISNPPYFKIGRKDPRAVAASHVVHGQPNMYALFMAVGAALLKARGDFVYIVPRSFASGPYFRRFRGVFFDMVRPLGVHVFASRRDAFSRDAVLQENVILSGVRDDDWSSRSRSASLFLSSSRGVGDIVGQVRREVSADTALDPSSRDKVLRLPLSDEDDAALALVDSWPGTLHDLGLDISTGPVIPFRATQLVDREGDVPATHVPLLWMNHVRPMAVTWPLDRHKPEYVRRDGADAVLAPNRNYVLLRRFSAKEEVRRLTAAPYIASRFNVRQVGLENHLNYIHRPGGTLTEDEAWGLAALYNSRLLDTYFRTVNGNTQVSATELRAMPLPDRAAVVMLGRRAKNLPDHLGGLDELVMQLLVYPGFEKTAVG